MAKVEVTVLPKRRLHVYVGSKSTDTQTEPVRLALSCLGPGNPLSCFRAGLEPVCTHAWLSERANGNPVASPKYPQCQKRLCLRIASSAQNEKNHPDRKSTGMTTAGQQPVCFKVFFLCSRVLIVQMKEEDVSVATTPTIRNLNSFPACTVCRDIQPCQILVGEGATHHARPQDQHETAAPNGSQRLQPGIVSLYSDTFFPASVQNCSRGQMPSPSTLFPMP